MGASRQIHVRTGTSAMSYNIQRAAVVGAGIMGAGIAALLASAGIPVLLLDIVPPDAPDSVDPAVRNRFALGGIDKALKARPATMLLEGRGEDFRRHFLITHSFNPVRFMKLLELVAGPDTDAELMRYMGEFCSAKLGKGVVY